MDSIINFYNRWLQSLQYWPYIIYPPIELITFKYAHLLLDDHSILELYAARTWVRYCPCLFKYAGSK